MLNRILINLIIISFILFTGCVQSKELETLGILNTRGVDLSKENNGQIETTLLIYQFDAQNKNISKLLSGTGNTLKDAREDANNKTTFLLTPGQIRLELYGKEIAQKGILRYLAALARDSRASDTMLLAISDTTAKDVLMKGQSQTEINVGQFLHGVIDTEYNEDSLLRIDLQTFSHMFADIGHDPILPIISLENDLPKLSAMAVFQDDKYVDKISLDDGFLLNLFQNRVSSAPVELTIPREPFKKYEQYKEISKNKEEELHIRVLLKGKSKTKMTNVQEQHFKTDIDLDIEIQEFSQLLNIENGHVADLLKKEIAKEIEQQYDTLLNKLQEINADPFGFGNIYRSNKKDGKLTKKEWREKFPEIKVDFNVKVRLLNYGTTQ
ncbi:Ger(x)C family spore germination protein [Virgibacillus profundi]|uniref:Ger(x)C family spore germination protein n=1 Tax=Virgibacillus profundi TaxID=2024555 RepID=UPI0013FDD34E|nr:Ger(x)C family spore germination protein [Virgibacillus profundi]